LIDIFENTTRKCFETKVGDAIAFIEYIRAKGAVYLTHTEVPKALEGQGIASTLVKGVLTILKNEEAKIAPLCPFVAAYIKRHPEWKTMLDPGYNV